MLKNKNLRTAALFILVLLILSFFKGFFAVGAKNFAVPAATPLLPMLPAFAGTFFATIFIALRASHQVLTKGTLTGIILVMHIPTAAATLYFAVFYKVLHANKFNFYKKTFLVGYPLLCITLFCMHPVGKNAFFYSLFWLVPIFLSFKKNKNIFYTSLATTMIAHATGSVIWLYLGLINSPEVWLSLVPIVILERIIFTLEMTFCFSAVKYLGAFFGRYLKNSRGRKLITFERAKTK